MPNATGSTWRSAHSSPRRVSMATPIRALVHVANLPATTTERALREMFGSLGQMQSARVVASRSAGGLAYGFVEYVDVASAERAIRTMDGWVWFGTPIKVCWAKHSMHPDAVNEWVEVDRPVGMRSGVHSHLFVGDLSPDVDDALLQSFFSRFTSLADVRVMYDAATGKSRGFGFINFRSKQDADDCIATCQGQWLRGRQIRVNWANQKNQPSQAPATLTPTATATATATCSAYSDTPLSLSHAGSGVSTKTSATPSELSSTSSLINDASLQVALPRRHTTLGSQPQLSTITRNPANILRYNYDRVVSEAPSSQTSVYVGNISPLTSQQDLVRIFSPFAHGHHLEARIPPGRGYGFVTLNTHEQAASAICTLSIQGVFMHSRWLRFGWQKNRPFPLPIQHRSESAPEHMLYTLHNQPRQHTPNQSSQSLPSQQNILSRTQPQPHQQKPPPPSSSSSSNEFQPF